MIDILLGATLGAVVTISMHVVGVEVTPLIAFLMGFFFTFLIGSK